MAKRWSSFHGKPIDRTQYDKEMLGKQLDLEIVTITLTKNGGKEVLEKDGGQCGPDYYKRTTSRAPNEEGRYRRLIKELEDMSH